MRVAIVNDLTLAATVLRRLVLSSPEHTVAWTAADGAEAVRRAALDRPDVILMDLVMPVLDGVEATRQIMAESPCPILLVTSSVAGNIRLVYEAMGHGALDAVNTPRLAPDGTFLDGEPLLQRLDKLAQTARACATRDGEAPVVGVVRPSPPGRRAQGPLVALGASTGGPEALAQVLGALPRRFAAGVLIVQHISAEFAPGLATWLQQRSGLPVRLALADDEPLPGQVLLAGSDDHLVLRGDGRLGYTAEPSDCPYRPSVDELFLSLAAHGPRAGVAVLLTGMGCDGAAGLYRLRQAGWHTIAQDEATSVVYGMPRAAAERGAVAQQLPLPHIADAITAEVPRLTRGS
jgi:two-component system response regulator WspF